VRESSSIYIDIPQATHNLSISFGNISPTQRHHLQSYPQSALLNSRRKRSRLNYNPDTSHTYISHMLHCCSNNECTNLLHLNLQALIWQALCNLNRFSLLPPITKQIEKSNVDYRVQALFIHLNCSLRSLACNKQRPFYRRQMNVLIELTCIRIVPATYLFIPYCFIDQAISRPTRHYHVINTKTLFNGINLIISIGQLSAKCITNWSSGY